MKTEDIALDLHGLSATLLIMSQAFSGDREAPASDYVEASLYGLSVQIERLCNELTALQFPPTNYLRKIRTDCGFTLDDLEKQTGISCAELKKTEDGEDMCLTTRQIAKLAEVLNVKPSEIFVT